MVKHTGFLDCSFFLVFIQPVQKRGAKINELSLLLRWFCLHAVFPISDSAVCVSSGTSSQFLLFSLCCNLQIHSILDWFADICSLFQQFHFCMLPGAAVFSHKLHFWKLIQGSPKLFITCIYFSKILLME